VLGRVEIDEPKFKIALRVLLLRAQERTTTSTGTKTASGLVFSSSRSPEERVQFQVQMVRYLQAPDHLVEIN
jgi:hypothetical protein